ncbi:T9SS type A sorting domain-containing protein [Mesonia maritima]|uniref:Secretion system C-terminal sorting domain-containing protein n=1 Tax=Mesonia maritima TaxID=1793873 RepID=A0ABU1K6D0_9FLAO|nr:T9SS type A sorting domain-containing protein [Mesonia maritima]MDR6301169.1 hypothetical protein [Mesonia maritima]
MKNLIPLFLFSVCFFASAQQQGLAESTWHLEELTISNNNISIPQDDNADSALDEINLWFNGDILYTQVCNVLDSFEEIQYVGNNEFLMEEWNQTLIECNKEENQNFEQNYFSFFTNHINTPIAYTITNNSNGSQSLILMLNNGDFAVYNNQQLSLKKSNKFAIALYPNPVKDYFTIKNDSNLFLKAISIYNLQGKLVREFMPTEKNEYRVINLNGVYLVRLETEKGFETKQIIVK